MKFLFGLIACVIACAYAAEYETEDGVVVLNDGNFAGYVEENDKVLVEFYAPWCGHCKKLAPEYKRAAEILAGSPPLAKVDCTAEKDTCSKFGVRGYPTLKFFTAGEASEYGGGRDADGIVSWISARLKPAVTELSDETALKAFQEDSGLNVVGYLSDEADTAAFSDLADTLRDTANFGVVSDAELAKGEGITSFPAVILHRSFDDPKVTFDGTFSKKAVTDFVNANSFPLVGEIGPDNYSKYMERGLPLMWISVKPEDEEHKALLEATRSVAKEFTSSLSFVYLDGVKYESHLKNLGLSTGPPGAIIVAQPKKYVHPEGEVTAETLKTFATGFADGSLTPFMKSQEPPESNDEPVTVVVGKSFNEIVMDETKNVLMEFYAPWCGHCKKLAPIYDALGEEFADNDSVVIGKMDSTENDGPIEISGFPTLYFFPAGGKESIKYSGDRTQEAMSEFIHKQLGTTKPSKDEL